MRWGLFGLLPLVLIVGGYWYVTGGQIMSTDDAYVNAEKVGISTDVAGIVQDVDVTTTSTSRRGRFFTASIPCSSRSPLDNAKANLAQAALTIDSMKQDYKRMLSDVAAQQAQVDLDQTNYNRALMLLHSSTVPQADLRPGQYTLRTDKSKLDSLRQQAAVQLGQARRQYGHPDARSSRNICRPRRRSTKRSASSITPSSRRRSAAS